MKDMLSTFGVKILESKVWSVCLSVLLLYIKKLAIALPLCYNIRKYEARDG